MSAAVEPDAHMQSSTSVGDTDGSVNSWVDVGARTGVHRRRIDARLSWSDGGSDPRPDQRRNAQRNSGRSDLHGRRIGAHGQRVETLTPLPPHVGRGTATVVWLTTTLQ